MQAQPLLYLKCTKSLQVFYEELQAILLHVGHEPKRGQAAPGAAAAFREAVPPLGMRRQMFKSK